VIQRFLAKIQEKVVYSHEWRKGDLIIFDNDRFLHGRMSDGIDKIRHLYRIWISFNYL